MTTSKMKTTSKSMMTLRMKMTSKITKLYKTLQNIEIRSFPPPAFRREDCQGSFGSMPELP